MTNILHFGQILKDNMLVNVGEAYIVVNIVKGRLIDQDTDLQQPQGAESGQQMHIAPGLDI